MTLYAQEGAAVKWKVLDDQTNTGEEGLFLFADKHLGQSSGSVYHRLSSWGEPFPEGFDYSDTLYRNWCVMFYENSLTAGEQSAVLATIKGDQAYETEDGLRFAADSDILSGEKIFCLSAEEADSREYGFTDNASRLPSNVITRGGYWLRSLTEDDNTKACIVDDTGQFLVNAYTIASAQIGGNVRPAFNLDPDAVALISPATGGKADGVGSTLEAVPDYSGNEWKLTLLDENRSFSVKTDAASAAPGEAITVGYTGAGQGAGEYVTAMICSEEGSILYYGHIAQGSESGEAAITIPRDLAEGNYTLQVFSEQCNGDRMTDYASDPQEITLSVSEEKEPEDPEGEGTGGVDPGEEGTGGKEPDGEDPDRNGGQPAGGKAEDGDISGAPQTGDKTTVFPYAAALAASSGAMLLLTGIRIKKNKRGQ